MRAEHTYVSKVLKEQRINTANVLDHISVHLDRIENNMQSAIVSDKVAQLRADVVIIVEGRNALSSESNLRFSSVANRLAIVKQNFVSALIPGPKTRVSKRLRRSAKKGIYLLDSNSASSKTYHRQTMEKSNGTVVELCSTDDARRRTLAGKRVLDALVTRSYDPLSCFMITLCHIALTGFRMSPTTLVSVGQVMYAIT